MYTDPRHTYEYVSAVAAQAGIQIEVEAAAGICRRIGAILDPAAAAPVGSTPIDGVRCPTGALIESFGVTITEAITNANATHCIVALKYLSIEGATAISIASLTVPKDSTEAAITTAPTAPSDRTGTQAVAVGARLTADAVKGSTMGFSLGLSLGIPFDVPPGGVFYVEVVQAAGAVGGAIRPFVVCQHKGQPAATSASPVTRVFA